MMLTIFTFMLQSLFFDKHEKRTEESIYEFSMKNIDGSELNFAELKGKPMVIINTASKCGYTPQYEGLQKLHEEFGDKIQFIGVPANNFLRQEPGSNDDISSFCSVNYGVSFKMTEKVSVKGKDMHVLFQWLTQQENSDFTGNIKWNFEKFMIDKDGKLVRRFRSSTDPLSEEFRNALMKLT